MVAVTGKAVVDIGLDSGFVMAPEIDQRLRG